MCTRIKAREKLERDEILEAAKALNRLQKKKKINYVYEIPTNFGTHSPSHAKN